VKGVFLSIETEKPPVWFEHMIVSAKTLHLADRLLTLLEDFKRIDTIQSDLDSSALRLLFLHHWRKMALRESTWAHIWLNKDSPIARCHIGVTTILSTLPKFGMLQKAH